ncbi:hypothetical protein TNCV_4880981 [Trichonephila clavipes]|nr:hypothetical protein TNCV_4880981 [Trichonephila clavipes]
MPRITRRNAFHQVTEFDRSKIVAYREYRFSFCDIASLTGRNPAIYSDDHIHVRRLQGDCSSLARSRFLHRRLAPGAIVRVVIEHMIRSSLVRIDGNLNVDRLFDCCLVLHRLQICQPLKTFDHGLLTDWPVTYLYSANMVDEVWDRFEQQ